MAWTKDQVEIMKHNNAIRARNRCMREHSEYLSIEYKEMPLEKMPSELAKYEQERAE